MCVVLRWTVGRGGVCGKGEHACPFGGHSNNVFQACPIPDKSKSESSVNMQDHMLRGEGWE